MKFSCRLGLHTWYFDSAWFLSSEKCNSCEKPRNQQASDDVDFERHQWKLCTEEGLSFDEALPKVLKRLMDEKIIGANGET